MDELITWLRAQLDEDERLAREAPGPDWHRAIEREGKPGYWRGIKAELVTLRPDRPSDSLSVGADVARCADYRPAEHIARWDPARVLADIEAKRRILDAYEQAYQVEWGDDPMQAHGEQIMIERVIELIALPYADRDGYREEWRP